MYRWISVFCFLLLSAACSGNPLYDFDGDGTSDSSDCAPSDPAIHPGAYDKGPKHSARSKPMVEKDTTENNHGFRKWT